MIRANGKYSLDTGLKVSRNAHEKDLCHSDNDHVNGGSIIISSNEPYYAIADNDHLNFGSIITSRNEPFK